MDYGTKKGFKNPNNDEEATAQRSVAYFRKALNGSLHATMPPRVRNYFKQYRENYYQLSYLEANGNEKLTRPIRYSHTAQELQTIIDTDLVSGSSGFLVSKLGDITEPRYGPFLLQSKSKGVRNELYLRPGLQTNPYFISGRIGGYRGDVNEYAALDLTYHKTGIQPIEVEIYGSEIRSDVSVDVHFECQVYDMTVGMVTSENKPTDILRNFERNTTNQGKYRGTGVIWEPANTMVILTKAFKTHIRKSMYVDFDKVLDSQNVDEPIKVTNARQIFSKKRVLETNLYPNASIPAELWTDGNGYKSIRYHEYGAPYNFWAHKYDNFKLIRIADSNQLRSFRIPPQHIQSVIDTKAIYLTDCPNLEYVYFHPSSLRNVRHFVVSGCNADWLNDYSRQSPLNKHHDTKKSYRHIFKYPSNKDIKFL